MSASQSAPPTLGDRRISFGCSHNPGSQVRCTGLWTCQPPALQSPEMKTKNESPSSPTVLTTSGKTTSLLLIKKVDLFPHILFLFNFYIFFSKFHFITFYYFLLFPTWQDWVCVGVGVLTVWIGSITYMDFSKQFYLHFNCFVLHLFNI